MFLNQVSFVNYQVNMKPKIRVRYQKYSRAQMIGNSVTAERRRIVGQIFRPGLVTPGAGGHVPWIA